MTIGEGATADTKRTALVVGATGIAGSALVDTLAKEGWTVLALSRHPAAERPGVRWLSADLTSAASLNAVLAPEKPSHVFFTAWSRRDTEEENITVNAGMLRDLLAALRGKHVAHVALMTGLNGGKLRGATTSESRI
ncbi:NAD-dependent epimerase/dehydratase family protein [Pseudarthrobacter sp. NamB4]|uniref:NAD-dependent epimerase/dehydratase family protein n=1 Tax=Pseudarthrobacter sp. NamB4 TaxID=2576837 RepID=UPI00268FFCF9